MPRLSFWEGQVKRSAQAKGFEVIPRRWVVERTIAWINRCCRLAKDYENLNRTAIAFIRLASIRLMLRRLTRYCYPSCTFRTDSLMSDFKIPDRIFRPPFLRCRFLIIADAHHRRRDHRNDG